jgi:hypothetical protein
MATALEIVSAAWRAFTAAPAAPRDEDDADAAGVGADHAFADAFMRGPALAVASDADCAALGRALADVLATEGGAATRDLMSAAEHLAAQVDLDELDVANESVEDARVPAAPANGPPSDDDEVERSALPRQRLIATCAFARAVIELRVARRERVAPWLSLVTRITRPLQCDDLRDCSASMPPSPAVTDHACIAAQIELLHGAVAALRVDPAPAHAGAASGSYSTFAGAHLLAHALMAYRHATLSLAPSPRQAEIFADAARLVWDAARLRHGGLAQRGATDGASDAEALATLVGLGCELGALRAAVRELDAAAAAPSHKRARFGVPRALRERLLAAGDLAGALSSGVRRASSRVGADVSIGSGATADFVAAGGAAAAQAHTLDVVRAGRVIVARADAANHTDRRLRERFVFASSDDSGDDAAEAAGAGARVSGDGGGPMKELATFARFLQFGTTSQPREGAHSAISPDDVRCPRCVLASATAAAGWVMFLVAEASASLQQVDAAQPPLQTALSLLAGLVPATPSLHCAPPRVASALVSAVAAFTSGLALHRVPLYSIVLEALPDSVRRLDFSRSDAPSEPGLASARDRDEADDARLAAVTDAILARRTPIGEALAVTLQGLAWLAAEFGQRETIAAVEQPAQDAPRHAPSLSAPLIGAMNDLLLRCGEDTRFKLLASLLLLSPSDSIATTFIAGWRFCVEADLRLCEGAVSADPSRADLLRSDLRSPFLDGALTLFVLAAALRAWSSRGAFWFLAFSDAAMTVLQLITWFRSVDTRMRRVSAARRLVGADTDAARDAAAAAVRAARASILRPIRERVETAARPANGAAGGMMIRGGSIDELKAFQFGNFLKAADAALDFFVA